MVKHIGSLRDYIYIAEVLTSILSKLVKLKDMVSSMWQVNDVFNS